MQAIHNKLEDLLSNLNLQQKDAVTSVRDDKAPGSLLVVAGAGSGKTHVLMLRIAYLILQGIVKASQILCVTFTRKAKNEMRSRIHQVGIEAKEVNKINICTFHSFCYQMLRSFGDKIGISGFNLLKADDQVKIIKSIIIKRALDLKENDPKSLRSQISKLKNEKKTPKEFYSEASGNEKLLNVADIYFDYQTELKKRNAIDFDDLQLKALKLLEEFPEVLKYYRHRYKYVCVDEFQDCNVVQYEITKLICQHHQNICCVGDDDQSIYGFRGGTSEFMLNFEKDWPDSKVVILDKNYRSTEEIVNISNKLISHNKNRREKHVQAVNKNNNKSVFLEESYDPEEEAQMIAKRIKEFVKSDSVSYSDCAVLYRANYQSRAIEDALKQEKIPYEIVGGISFYKRSEIKDILAYLYLINDLSDNQAFRRIVNTPKRAIGQKSLDALETYAHENELSLFEAAQNCDSVSLSKRARNSVKDFVYLIEKFRDNLKSSSELGDFLNLVYQKTGYENMLTKKNTEENLERINNIKELINIAHFFSKDQLEKVTLKSILEEFFEMLDLSDPEEITPKESVKLLTIHKSKGLEFPVVFVPGLVEGVLPSYRSIEENKVPEERRLCYVAMTRAENQLILSYSLTRFGYKRILDCQPSRFLEETEILKTIKEIK